MNGAPVPLRSPWRDQARAAATMAAARPAPPPSSQEARLARMDAICDEMLRLLSEARELLDEVTTK